MPSPASVSSLPKGRSLSLELADDVRPCLSAFEPTFLEFLTRAPTPRPHCGHRWTWEPLTTSDAESDNMSLDIYTCHKEVDSTCNLFAHGGAVRPEPCAAIYQPSKVHHRQAQQNLSPVVTLAPLRVGLNSSAYIKRADVIPTAPGKGRDSLTYVSKVWPRDQVDSWVGFCSELSIYKSARYLFPLQGVIIPRLLGVHSTDSGFAFNMEIPHPVFWFEASATMPDVLKAKVISAYSDLHVRGVLHGDVALRHILVGGDARVTIIDFQESRALVGDDAVGLGSATRSELATEMRRVRYVLDFEGARAYEDSKTRREAERRKRNKAVARDLERRRRASLPLNNLKLDPPAPDDVAIPPIHPEELREWRKSCNATLRRVVMPGVSEARLCSALSDFFCIVKQLLDGDACWSLLSESSASVSPSPSSVDHSLPVFLADVASHLDPRIVGTTAYPATAELPETMAERVASSRSGEGDRATSTSSRSSSVEHQTGSFDDSCGDNAVIISTSTSSPAAASKRTRDSSDDAVLDLEASPTKRLRQAKHSNTSSASCCTRTANIARSKSSPK
ncbi:hypothetical protein PENSPDRAFT_647126 [Peniophora sp. CONT]|nr:hypothetical protein PENSPDRAFT_647126 [Peniophora sp. CONT]